MTGAPPDLLQTIVAATRVRVANAKARESATELEARARLATPDGGRFLSALSRSGRANVIAECKRRSPSRGVLRAAYDPVAIAVAYADAGAAALSVLTEPMFFDGSLEHLARIRAAVSLPLLRKDFIVDSYQVVEAVAAGADAILLIVAALDDRELRDLGEQARSRGLAALVEVHSEGELERALTAGATIIGVNNRNLRTLEVDVDLSRRIALQLPDSVVAVSESGLKTPSDLQQLGALGYRAFLMGERFMTTPAPGAALAGFLAEVAQ
jgi:indole-3-glycerol phosphate synthase